MKYRPDLRMLVCDITGEVVERTSVTNLAAEPDGSRFVEPVESILPPLLIPMTSIESWSSRCNE